MQSHHTTSKICFTGRNHDWSVITTRREGAINQHSSYLSQVVQHILVHTHHVRHHETHRLTLTKETNYCHQLHLITSISHTHYTCAHWHSSIAAYTLTWLWCVPKLLSEYSFKLHPLSPIFQTQTPYGSTPWATVVRLNPTQYQHLMWVICGQSVGPYWKVTHIMNLIIT